MARRLSSLAVIAIALAGAIGVWKGPQPSEGLQAVTVGIDVDPTGNAATTLGTLERCTSVANSAGSQFTIDVFIDEIPSGQNIAGFEYSLHFDASRLVLAAQDHSLLLASAPGSQPFDTLGDRVPDTDGSHLVAVADFGPEEAGPVKGVLGRYTMEVLTGAPNGVADFSLSELDVGRKEPGQVVNVDQILSASIGLGADCSAEPPPATPGTVPTPTPDETPAADQTPGTDQLRQETKERLLGRATAGLNLEVSLDTVTVGGATALFAVFADEDDQPVSGVDITFGIEQQPGTDASLEGESEVTKTSDDEGVAEATLKVGSKTGTIEVSATAEGQTETINITVVEETPTAEATPTQRPGADGQPSTDDATSGDGGSWGYVIGGVIAGAVALALATGGTIWWWRRRAGGNM